MSAAINLQSIAILIWPAIAIRLGKTKLPEAFSPIVLCYLFGIVLRNTPWFPLDDKLSENWMNGSILMAIPILLFATDMQRCIRYAGRSLLAFGLCVVGALLGSGLTAFLYPIQEAPAWMVSGMLTGVYVGSTANMQAVGIAVGAPQEVFILVNAADIVCGGIWLIALTSVVHPLLKGVLPDFPERTDVEDGSDQTFQTGVRLADTLKAIGLAVGIVAAALGICYLVFGDLQHTTFVMLLLTTFGIGVAFFPAVKQWKGVYETGEYFLLMFCVALGLQADFTQLLEKGVSILIFAAIAMMLSMLFHLILSRLFRIDRDTFLISSTAGIYGAAFIGQVASAIRNRQLIFPGIALALLGCAFGNYAGIALAYALKWALF